MVHICHSELFNDQIIVKYWNSMKQKEISLLKNDKFADNVHFFNL